MPENYTCLSNEQKAEVDLLLRESRRTANQGDTSKSDLRKSINLLIRAVEICSQGVNV